MAELQIKITTQAQLQGAEQAKRALQEAVKATKEGSTASAELKRQLDAVNGALTSEAANAVRVATGLEKAIAATRQAGGNPAALQAQLNQTRQAHGLRAPGVLAGAAAAASEIPGMGGMARFATGPAGAAAGVVAGLGLAIKEYAQAEEAVAKLDAALAQNGQLTEGNRVRYQELAGQLQKTTGIADDEWISVLTRLTQFGSTPESIGMDTEAVKNLAGLLGGDVSSAAQAYAKALQGNFDMFGRYGIVVGEAGTQTEKLQRLQEQLAQRGGGQLEASAKTLSGQYRQLKNATSDLFEAMGRGFSQTGVGQSVLYGLATSADWLAQKLGGTIPALDGMENKLGSAAKAAADAEAATKQLALQEENLKKAAEEAATALNKELTALDNNLRRKLEMAEATRQLAEAQIDADSTKTPEEKAAAKAVLRAKTDREREDAEIANVETKKARVVESRQMRAGELGSANRDVVVADERVKAEQAKEAAEQRAVIARKARDAAKKELADHDANEPDAEAYSLDPELAQKRAATRANLKARVDRAEKGVLEEDAKIDDARKKLPDTESVGVAKAQEKAEAAKQRAKQLKEDFDAKDPKDAEAIKELDAEAKHKRDLQAANGRTRKQVVQTAVQKVDPTLPDQPPEDRPPEKRFALRPQLGPPVPPEIKRELDEKRRLEARVAELEGKITRAAANATAPGVSEAGIESNRRQAAQFALQREALLKSAGNVASMSDAVTVAMQKLERATATAAARARNGR